VDLLGAGLALQWNAVLRCYAAGQGSQAYQLAYRLGAATGALLNTCSSNSSSQGQQGAAHNAGAAAAAGVRGAAAMPR
jgi:hypothetical protein